MIDFAGFVAGVDSAGFPIVKTDGKIGWDRNGAAAASNFALSDLIANIGVGIAVSIEIKRIGWGDG